eukprot:6208311-Pleurochrysis_carterae.AAC.5
MGGTLAAQLTWHDAVLCVIVRSSLLVYHPPGLNGACTHVKLGVQQPGRLICKCRTAWSLADPPAGCCAQGQGGGCDGPFGGRPREPRVVATRTWWRR